MTTEKYDELLKDHNDLKQAIRDKTAAESKMARLQNYPRQRWTAGMKMEDSQAFDQKIIADGIIHKILNKP